MKGKIMKFLRDEAGLTAVEYAVAGALVAAIVAGGFTLLGGNVDAMLTHIAGLIVVP